MVPRDGVEPPTLRFSEGCISCNINDRTTVFGACSRMKIQWLAVAVSTFFAASVQAADLPGPVPAEVVSVIDGDTIDVTAHPWPGITVSERVRIAVIDTPEIGRAACPAERERGLQAKARLSALLASGEVTLTAIEGRDSYGRILAEVRVNGLSVGEVLLSEGLAVRYRRNAQNAWCD